MDSYNNRLYTASEAADILQVHVNTIKNWHREGKIKGVQVGTAGWIRIPQSEIDRIWFEEKEGYLRPICPKCMSDDLSWMMAAGNGLVCLHCGTTYFLTVGKTRKDIPVENK